MTNKLWSPGVVVDSPWLNDANTKTYSALTAVAGTNTITATGPLAYAFNISVPLTFIPALSNGGPTTININGLGAKNIVKYVNGIQTPLVALDLVAGANAVITYNGTVFELLNPQTLPTAASQTGRLLNTQTFTASGTYTPTVGTTTIIVEVVGGGGAGGGALAAGAGTTSIGGGGGSGAYSRGKFAVPPPTAVTIGAGGAGVGGATGNAGTASSLGALITAPAGAGGATGSALAITFTSGGAGGGVGTGGNLFSFPGQPGGGGYSLFAAGAAISGVGGGSGLSGGANSVTTNSGASGFAAIANSGSGGSGGANFAVGGTPQGGAGGSGIIIIYEYS